MSRYSAIKKALEQVAMENDNTGELQSLRRVLMAQQEVPHYHTDDGGEQFKDHQGPAVVHAWSGVKEDHHTFEDVMSGFGHSDSGYAGKGMYAGNKKAASRYAEKPGRKLKNVTFKFKNPLVRTSDNWQDPIMPYDWIPKRTQELEDQGMDWPSARAMASSEYPTMLKKHGYDGFIDAVRYENNELGEIVAYHPETVEIHANTVQGEIVREFVKLAAEEKKSLWEMMTSKPQPATPAQTTPAQPAAQTTKQNLLDLLKETPAQPQKPAQTANKPAQPQKPAAAPAQTTKQNLLDLLKETPANKPAQPAQRQTPVTTPPVNTEPAQIPAQPAAQTQQNKIKGLTEEESKKMQALRDAVMKKQLAKNDSELQDYVKSQPLPEQLVAMVSKGHTLVTMPKSGTPLDEIPVVPDGAYDEVADMTVEDLGVVSYPDGKPVYAAFGDKSEYEGLLKAAGFKPMLVYFFPRTDNKKGWKQAKRANMYVCVGQAGKDAVEAAWSNPNHPVAIAGRAEQARIDSRKTEAEFERKKYQDNIDRIQRTQKPFSEEGYDTDSHRKSYAHKPHKMVAIPTPTKLTLSGDDKQLEYLPYQIAAVSFINERLGGKDDAKPDAERGAILADSPGIGKTMPAIGVISTNPSIRKVLVVCPSVMVPVWIAEMKKWLAGEHVRDTKTQRLKVKIGRYKKEEELPDITVMSYESLSKASKDISNPERIGDRAWDYVILDESHRVKDEHSVQACVIMGGRPKRRTNENKIIPELKTPGDDNLEYPGVPSKRRLLLTGTPIPSYSWELYANLRFVRPDIFNNEDEFMYQFAVMKAFRTTAWKRNKQTGAPELHRIFITKPVRPQNMTLLNKMLFGGGTYHSGGKKKHFDGIAMRRIHKDLEALGSQYTWPPKGQPQYRAIVESQDYTGLDAQTATLNALEQRIKEAKSRNASDDELAELENEYSNKVKVSFQRVAKVRNAIGMKKAPYVAAEAAIQAKGNEQNRPNKVLVFAYHKNVIESIAAGIEQQFKALKHPEWKVAIVYGATSDKKRQETFEQFQNDPNVKVIVASYKVLKEGITLTAANKVIHAELMPNPIDYEQAYARAWRRGQDRNVGETYIWLPKTFDERLYEIASGKYAAANKILNHRLPEPQKTTEQ